MTAADKLSKRPEEYLWETGLSPLVAGSGFFLLGASELLQRILPQTGMAQQGIKWLALFAVAAVIWGARFIRDRVVSPRGGYVVPADPRWFLWVVLLAMILSLLLAYTLAPAGILHDRIGFIDHHLVAPGFAVLFGILSLYYGRMRMIPLLFCIYLMFLASLIWWLPISETEEFGLLQAGAGGPLAVFGVIRVRAFLKANPEPVDLTTGG